MWFRRLQATVLSLCTFLFTWGKVILIRLNLLCSRLEITILPPPGGPMDASKCMPWEERINQYVCCIYLTAKLLHQLNWCPCCFFTDWELCDVDHCMNLRDLSLLLLYILKRNCYFTAHVFAGLVRSELSAKVSPVAFYQRVKGFDSLVNADSVCWLCSLIRIQRLPKIQPWNWFMVFLLTRALALNNNNNNKNEFAKSIKY